MPTLRLPVPSALGRHGNGSRSDERLREHREDCQVSVERDAVAPAKAERGNAYSCFKRPEGRSTDARPRYSSPHRFVSRGTKRVTAARRDPR